MKVPSHYVLILSLILVACGGDSAVKNVPRPSPSAKPANSVNKHAPNNPQDTATTAQDNAPHTNTNASKPGGYYLDDGPGETPPQNIDSIPSAVPKKEALLTRANKPYKALGQKYTPMKSYQAYKEKGIASWYGKRFHGKKTANGEVYDMYGMSAAHTTLPLPSYAKVTNPANGRSVIVRVNDRGPFKSSRMIDLSYAAAYQLRFISNGSTLVEVEAIDPSQPDEQAAKQTSAPVAASTSTNENTSKSADTNNMKASEQLSGYFVQLGAFKNESNVEKLSKKIQSLALAENAGINSVYNNGLYRLRLGPFSTKQEADTSASNIRRQLNISTIVSN